MEPSLYPPIELRSDQSFLQLLSEDYLRALECYPHTVYGVWSDLRLAYTNPAWFLFAQRNGGQHITEDWPIGRPVLDAVPEIGRHWYSEFFAEALRRQKESHPKQHEYECSSSKLYRRFVMTAYPLENSQKGLVLVHSLSVQTAQPSEAAPVLLLEALARYTQSTGLIRQCMHCRRVCRPHDPDRWDWVPALVDEPQRNVTHGLCGICLEHFYPGHPKK
jgi:hypothetical protein